MLDVKKLPGGGVMAFDIRNIYRCWVIAESYDT